MTSLMSTFIITLAVPSYSTTETSENIAVGQDGENNNNNAEQTNEKNQASEFNALCISGVVSDESCNSSSEQNNGMKSESVQGPPGPKGEKGDKGDKGESGSNGNLNLITYEREGSIDSDNAPENGVVGISSSAQCDVRNNTKKVNYLYMILIFLHLKLSYYDVLNKEL